MSSVTNDDYLWFVDQALDAMVAILTGLGDQLANRRPELPGANSPYAILAHCLGVMEYWGGYMVTGRTIERDRDAEFRSTGRVEDLVTLARGARLRLEADVAGVDPLAVPRGLPDPQDSSLPFGQRQGAVLLHVFEELSQHLGQMEISRDIILAGADEQP